MSETMRQNVSLPLYVNYVHYFAKFYSIFLKD